MMCADSFSLLIQDVSFPVCVNSCVLTCKVKAITRMNHTKLVRFKWHQQLPSPRVCVCVLSLMFLLSLVRSRQHVYVLSRARIEFMRWEGCEYSLQYIFLFRVMISLRSCSDSSSNCTAADPVVKLQYQYLSMTWIVKIVLIMTTTPTPPVS